MNAFSAAERAGARDVATWRADPSALARLPLGAFEHGTPLQVAVRRFLLALRLPPRVVAPFVGRRARMLRMLELTSYWRGVRRALRDRQTWRRLTQGTTILLYHAIAADTQRPTRFKVTQRAFERQMRKVAKQGRALRLDDLVALRQAHRLPPPGAVVITFDDGYAEIRSRAAPVLDELALPATFFVVSERVGPNRTWQGDGELHGRALVAWDDVEELRELGFEIGAHTRTHPNLRNLAPEQVEAEVAGSRADLAERLGSPPHAFAYPYGKWSETAADAARRAGFSSAVTIRTGRNCAATPLHLLRRAEVRGTDSRLRFALALRFGDTNLLADLARRLTRREA
ncbi:MAG: polysaccharide deacetylase family protein [Actinomycetota bacterium]|nr:polysaccharide deacetylase family protein [Actinomycetota bacterium]